MYFLKVGEIRRFSQMLETNLILNYPQRLRALEEIEKKANCSLDKNTENNEKKILYNCDLDAGKDKEPSSIKTTNKINFSDGTSPQISSQANATIDLMKQTEEYPDAIPLNNAILGHDQGSNEFNITGESDEDISGKKVTLSFDVGGGNLKNVPCNIEKLETGNKYILKCKAKEKIKAKINGVSGRIDGQIDGKEKVLVIVSEDDEVQDISDKEEQKNTFKKGSSGGLNGGAIAGIIISCAATLIITGILIVMCNKKNPHAPLHENTLGIKDNNINL
jgi:hypothetical protein